MNQDTLIHEVALSIYNKREDICPVDLSSIWRIRVL